MVMDMKPFLIEAKFEVTDQDGAIVCIRLDDYNFIFYKLKDMEDKKYKSYYDRKTNCFDTRTYLVAVSMDLTKFYPEDWDCCSVNLNLFTNEQLCNLMDGFDEEKEILENEEWLTCAEIIANNYFLS